MPKQLRERGRLLEATGTTSTGAVRRPIQIITPGWGSSGYYSAEILEAVASDRVIPAGTHMYFNHASESERHDRPERDVRDIAAVLAEDARWDGTRLIAEAEIMGPHAELIESLAPYIGVSISGSATDVVIGDAEGRTGPIIEGLARVDSVDFVTHAGRGGMVLLESARPSLVNARAVGHGVSEATANDTREALQNALREEYGGEKSWVWVRDFDEETVWFEHETPDESATWAEGYSIDAAGAVTLAGARVEVRARTEYVPVTRPDSTTPTTEADQEVTMGNIQIEESEHRSLVEKAGRVDALEHENATLKDTIAGRDRADRARVLIGERVTEAKVEPFTALETAGLLASLPLTEDGGLDEAAFTTTVDKALEGRPAVAEAATGPTGFGASVTGEVTESTTPTRTAWGRPLTEQKGA